MFIKNDFLISNKNNNLVKVIDVDDIKREYILKYMNQSFHNIRLNKKTCEENFTLIDDQFSDLRYINKNNILCTCGWNKTNNISILSHSDYCDLKLLIF